jgi:hypothetical protein
MIGNSDQLFPAEEKPPFLERIFPRKTGTAEALLRIE